MDVSVIIPSYNEAESLPELCTWVNKVLEQKGYTFEIIVIDDGSVDNTWSVIEQLSDSNPNVCGISFRRNYGKSAALNVGFRSAKGEVVITMDADLQDNPDELPHLIGMIRDEGFDLVSGWKKKRHDPLSKTLPSKFFNWVTRKVSGINNLHDFNCGLKAYRQEVVKNIDVYGEMHRYIPLIAKWAGFHKIGEKSVEHLPRKYGISKFGIERFVNGFLDLLSITFISRFGKRPMHVFGFFGTLSFMAGLAIAVYLFIAKFAYQAYHMTDRPLFYFGGLAMIIGVQLFLAGFLAEILVRNSSDRNSYKVARTTNGVLYTHQDS
jgi:glycosyltransferase involved in cell wall biosynthesis